MTPPTSPRNCLCRIDATYKKFVILSAGRSPESKDLRTDLTAIVLWVRRFFDSLCSLRMTGFSEILYYPSATSSIIIRVKPRAKKMVPMLEWEPSDISGISSSTTT